MSRVLDLDETEAHVDGLVHLDTQEAAVGLDLTVCSVYRITGRGSLDFGGSELRKAERRKVAPEIRSPDDDYGWWELEPGSYVIRYNESLELGDGQLAQILPLERLLLAGASHAAFAADAPTDPLETLLSVGEAGCDLKENCRVSRLVVLDTG